ncbi:MAG: aspartate aminotransferase [Caulobacteraceae bacterium]|nr:aspartate aminotransferase [Caulobacteraceae bacterium]
MREQGIDVIDLTVGEPDFDTPGFIKAAGVEAIDSGRTKYTALAGASDLVAAILADLAAHQGVVAKPAQVIACSGAKQVIHNAMAATLAEGDEVILPVPYWTTYPDIVRLEGGIPVFAPGLWSPQRGWRLDPQAIEAAITERTRWLLLNSPGNPSGSVIDAEEAAALVQVLRRHPHVWLLSDDIYRTIVFDGGAPPSLSAAYPELSARTLIVDGVSKAYAMTGWRLGWGIGPEPLIAAMIKVQSQTTSAPCSISQAAGAAALKGGPGRVADMVATFKSRRDATVARLNAMEGVRCPAPQGAFYLFPNIADLLGRATADGEAVRTDVDFTGLLLRQGVAAVPGSVFGVPDALRLSIAASDDELSAACDKLHALTRSLTRISHA